MKFRVVKRTYLTSGNEKFVVQSHTFSPSSPSTYSELVETWSDTRWVYDTLEEATNTIDELIGNYKDTIIS